MNVYEVKSMAERLDGNTYPGRGIVLGITPDGKKSVAFNLVLRADDRSLTGEEADAAISNVLSALEKELGAVLRG